MTTETPAPSAASQRKPVCLHCGAPSPSGDFCCSGCSYVHRLVHEEGLQAYYKIKDTVIPPADAAMLPQRDYGWLRTAQSEAELQAGTGTASLLLDIQGISCAGCVWLIEKLYRKQSGSGRIEINAQTGQMRLAWETGSFEAATFAATLQSFNYLVAPATAQRSAGLESKGLVRRIGLCTAFAMNIMLFALPAYFGMDATFPYAHLFGTIAMVCGTLSLIAGGGYFFTRAFGSLRAGVMSIDLPIALGIAGAYSGSFFGWASGRDEYVYFDFVGSFILLMLVGRWAQVAAVERNQRRLLAQQPVAPQIKLVDVDGVEKLVSPESIQSGQCFILGRGQTLPVEGRLVSAESEFNLAWINGESEPRRYKAGLRVPAGATLISREDAVFQAEQAWGQSMLAELLKPKERGGYRHHFIERVIQGYLIGVLVIATAAGIGWWLHSHDALKTGAVVTAILVVSCPCAIGLAFPLADEMATVALRKRGVFVRSGDLWPRLSRVSQLAFDKTGTLTFENPVLKDPAMLKALDPNERAALMALVCDNAHPVGRSLYELLLGGGRVDPMLGDVDEEIGFGVKLLAQGDVWTLGRAGWRGGKSLPAEGTAGAGAEFCRNGRVVAAFVFEESVRSDARDEVSRLGQRGLAVRILSGDRSDKVDAMVAGLGLPPGSGLGGMTPKQKADWIDAEGSQTTLMLGDGANDSLAFDRALCRGTPVIHRGVLEQKADFYYLGAGIGGIRTLFEVNDTRRRTQHALLVFSVAYNLLAVGLAIAGIMNPLLAAILMPGSSLLSLLIVLWGMKGAWKTVKV